MTIVRYSHSTIRPHWPADPWLIFPMKLDSTSTFVNLPCKNAFDLILDHGAVKLHGILFIYMFYKGSFMHFFNGTLIRGRLWNMINRFAAVAPQVLATRFYWDRAAGFQWRGLPKQKYHSDIRIQCIFVVSFLHPKRINEVWRNFLHMWSTLFSKGKMAASFSKICTGGFSFSCFSSFTSTFTTSSFEPSGTDSEPGQRLK